MVSDEETVIGPVYGTGATDPETKYSIAAPGVASEIVSVCPAA
jgi:hypothetical protein